MAVSRKKIAKKTTRKTTTPTVESLRSEIEAEAPEDPRITAARQAKKETVLKSVAAVNVEETCQQLATAGLGIAQALSGVQAELQEKVAELNSYNEAIQIKKEEIERLQGVEVIGNSIAQMIAEFDQKSKEFEDIIEERNNNWAKADEVRATKIDEENAQLIKNRIRDENDYTYKLEQTRRKETDEFVESIRARNVSERDRQEALSRSWQERESELIKAKEEINTARNTLAEEQTEVNSRIEKAVKKAQNSLHAEYGTKITLAKKDSQFAIETRDINIKNLESKVQDLLVQIEQVKKEAFEKEKSSQDMAKAAFESAAGRQALDALQESTKQQPSTRGR